MTSIVVSHDSTRAVTSSEDGTIIVWDIAGRAVLHEWVAHQGWPVKALTLSPDSIWLVSYCRGTLSIWDMGDGSPIKAAELKGHTREVNACTWSPDGTLIASASHDGTVRIWDGHTYQHRNVVPALPDSQFYIAESLRFSPDSSYIAWITGGRDCWIWRPLMGEQPKRLPLQPDGGDMYTTTFLFDPESRRIATAHGDGNNNSDACVVRIWDTATGTPIAVLAGHSNTVENVSFSPDGRSLLSVAGASVDPQIYCRLLVLRLLWPKAPKSGSPRHFTPWPGIKLKVCSQHHITIAKLLSKFRSYQRDIS